MNWDDVNQKEKQERGHHSHGFYMSFSTGILGHYDIEPHPLAMSPKRKK